MSDSLLYPIADATQVTLFHDGHTNQMRGARERTLKIGPWLAKTFMYVDTDLDGEKYSTAFVKIRKHLWGLMISGAPGDKPGRLYWVMFNGHEAGIKTGQTVEFATGSVRQTLEKIKPYVKAMLKFDSMKGAWTNVDGAELYPEPVKKAGDMDKGQQAQSG